MALLNFDVILYIIEPITRFCVVGSDFFSAAFRTSLNKDFDY
jgi:hypothetical protein